ncbi:hypothetical protein BDA96_04G320100 [Sorghum bicolor]|uniref:Uncharacterized protein n=2 Tax=Sorghum bicolor TaxID=4558 RepID=A0A921R7R9_SORBI|nr:hypothetical protein BDA96_04G320100 [Sorghum bicolor]OQU88143.1 hypothetical protein SORBI_3003G411150 [Sorghum bicolor]
MQVYGSISPHVMNIMAVAIMEEQFHKHMLDSLPSFEWCKHIFSHSVSVELQNSELVPSNISYHFSERCIGYSLDNADLVFVPACKNRYWYVVIANMRERRFEVICPFKDLNIVKEDAFVIVSNFRKVFKFSYPASRRVDVYRMGFAFASVSNSTSQYVFFTSPQLSRKIL